MESLTPALQLSYRDQLLDLYRESFDGKDIIWAKNKQVKQCHAAEFYKVASRDWVFECEKSEKFMDVEGHLEYSMPSRWIWKSVMTGGGRR